MPITDVIKKPLNEATTHKAANGLNEDIREALEQVFKRSVAQWTNPAKIFKGRNELQTAKLIWLYLKNHCTYRRDPDTHQLIRTPAYFLHNKPHLGDCKTFALFARSLYAAIYPDLPTAFKFTAYRTGAVNPSHVYTVVKDRNGNEIIIDGCWRKFNAEKKYTLALKPNFEKMRITSLADNLTNPSDFLNAINDHAQFERRDRIKQLQKLRNCLNTYRAQFDGGHITRDQYRAKIAEVESQINGINKKLTPEQKAARKKKLKADGYKFLWGIAFINLAPIRGAFASIVAMNFNAIAHNLKKVYENRNNKDAAKNTAKEWNKIKGIWKKVGGIEKALMKAIQLGAKHKPLFLSKKAKQRFEKRNKGIKGIYVNETEGTGINVAPAVIAAAVTAATGIIAAMIPPIMGALKKTGNQQAAQEVAEQGQELVAKNTNGQLQREVAQGADEQLNEDGLNGTINAADWSNLTEALTQVARVGITAAGTAIANKVKKKPKAKAALEKLGEGADDYFTGRYLRESGYKKTAQQFGSALNSKTLLIGGAAALAALLGFVVLKKK